MQKSEFTQLSSNTSISLEQYLYFKDTQKQYLDNKDITVEQVNELKKEYLIKENNTEINHKQNNNIGLDLLKIKSFYCNHNLFKLLIKDDKFKKDSNNHLYNKFNKKLYNQTYNELADMVDIEDLEKNLCLVDNKQVDFMVLQKSLIDNHKKLYDFIEPFLKWDKDRAEILQSMCYVIENYGRKVKNTNIAVKIKKHIYGDSFFKFQFYLDNRKSIENINNFFDIDIKKYVVEKKLPPSILKNLNFCDKQLESILYNVDKSKDNYFYIIYQYIKNPNSEKSISEKFKFLEKENLLNEKIWNNLINPHITDFVKVVFANNKILTNIIENNKLEQAISSYTEYFFKQKRSIPEIKEYIENCIYSIDRDNLVKIMNNVYTFSNYKTHFDIKGFEYAKSNYSEDIKLDQNNFTNIRYYKTIEEQVIKLLDYIYENFPEYMKNKDTILDLAKSSTNEILMGLYLDKYFKENNDHELKQTVAKNFKVMSLIDFSRTLQWLAENNLLEQVINEKNPHNSIFSENYYNYLIPCLLDKYNLNPNIVIKATFSPQNDNHELFKFVLNNYTIDKNTVREICDIVYIQNKTQLAEEIFKKNLVLSENLVEQCKLLRNEAGNILLKLYLKQKLENKVDTNTTHKSKEKAKMRKI